MQVKRDLCLLALSLSFSCNLLFGQISKEQVIQEIKDKGFGYIDENSILISNQYRDVQTGFIHVYIKQVVNGSEVFNTQSSFHYNKEGKLFYASLDFAGERVNVNKAATISAETALQIATVLAGVNLNQSGKAAIQLDESKSFIIPATGISSKPIKGKFCYYSNGIELLPAWQIEVMNDASDDWHNILVDASNGEILAQINYTKKCNVETINSSINSDKYFFLFEDKESGISASPTYNIVAIPAESPVKGGRSMVSNPSASNASPYGWHDTDGVDGMEFTITRGNNVWAKEDTLGNNGNGYSPDGDSSMTFDFPYNYTANPRENLDAGIANLFYMNSIMHDVMYNYGFTEAAGNFQTNNYGKGGVGMDAIIADAQDGKGMNNANFNTGTDGQGGRMQMFLWWPGGVMPSNNFKVNSPASISKPYPAYLSTFGPKPPYQGITSDIVWANDSSLNPTEGCYPLKNANEIAGKIAVIDRGLYLTAPNGCSYIQKIMNAQNAGAIGVVFVSYFTTITAGAIGDSSNVNIPSVMISNITGNTLKNSLSSGAVNVTMYDSALTGTIWDSGLDNGVIAHEYGHGVSNRLTGGPANPACLSNAENAGEGWSDFFALYMTAKPWETQLSGRGLANYLLGQDTNGIGSRQFRYSRNLALNPATYKNVAIYKETHGVGFVWCTMLYDLMLNMIDKYGYDQDLYKGNGGNNKTLQIIMLGLKLQKCSPGFVDSRNAIIAADSALNGGANYALIWKTFANRGLGYSAIQGSSSYVNDQIEAFDLPPILSIEENKETNAITIYPNPNNGVFKIFVSYPTNNVHIEICNILGILVHKQAAINELNSIDLSDQINGLYLVKVLRDNITIATQKIIKQ